MSKETETNEFKVYKQLYPYEAERAERASNENDAREMRFQNIVDRYQKESGRDYYRPKND